LLPNIRAEKKPPTLFSTLRQQLLKLLVISSEAAVASSHFAALAPAGNAPGDAPGDPLIASERIAQAAILVDLFDDLFRPVTLDPGWLAWNNATIRKLARSIYDERRFTDLPILADALEEAGCTDNAILKHCRNGGEHVRGCWVLDLLLGKK
jgi:hypothetical protein